MIELQQQRVALTVLFKHMRCDGAEIGQNPESAVRMPKYKLTGLARIVRYGHRLNLNVADGERIEGEICCQSLNGPARVSCATRVPRVAKIGT